MKHQPIIRLPQLYDAWGDLSKRLCVFYYVRNPKTGKMDRFRDYNISSNLSASKRYEAGKKLIQEITDKLKRGWTPFNEKTIALPDNLQFQTAVKEYHKAVARNGTFSFYASKYLEELALGHEPTKSILTVPNFACSNAGLKGKD